MHASVGRFMAADRRKRHQNASVRQREATRERPRPSEGDANPEDAAAGDLDLVDALAEAADVEVAPAFPSAGLAAAATIRFLRRVSGVAHAGGREIWRLALPIMLSQVLVSLVGLVDIAMVGRLGAVDVAAVGYATQLYFMSQSALFAVGFACVALMARAIGAGDHARARAALAASLGVALLTAGVVAAVVLAAPRAVLAWLNADPEVAELTIPYMRLLFVSSLLLAVSLTLEHGLRADRDTATPMRIALLVTAVKIGLNVLLIFGVLGAPRLGIVGAGVATVVSQVVAVVLFVWVIRGCDEEGPVALRLRDFVAARGLLGDVIKVAMPGVGERVVLNMALLSYFAVLGAYGTVAIAAYTVGVRILAFSWIPGTGFGAAAATLVGQALGAGDGDRAERTGWMAARIALVAAVVLGFVGGAAREPLARLFTSDAATIEALGPFMLILALAQPTMQVHFTLGGAHRGAGDTWTPLVAAAVGNWGFRVPVASFVAAYHLPLIWVWSALLFDHGARVVWLAVAFRGGHWKRKALRASRATLPG